jgi:hypothetical protein
MSLQNSYHHLATPEFLSGEVFSQCDIFPSPLYETAWASRFTGSLLGTPPRADTGCPSVWLQQIPATPFFAASTIVSLGDSSLTHFTRCLAALFWGEASHRRASHPIPALRDGVVLSRLRAKIQNGITYKCAELALESMYCVSEFPKAQLWAV